MDKKLKTPTKTEDRKMATRATKYTVNRGVKGPDGKNITRKIDVELPVSGTIQEFISRAGGEENALRFVNAAEIASAKGSLNLFVKAKDSKALSDTELDEKLTAMAPNVNVFSDSGPSKSDKLSFADAAFALNNDATLSDTEKAAKLLELIQKARG